MFERIERDTVTKARIKEDLILVKKMLFRQKTGGRFHSTISNCVLCLVLTVLWHFLKFPWKLYPVTLLPFFIYSLLCFGRYLERRAKQKEELKKIENDEFTVKQSTLSHTKEVTIYEPHVRTGRRSRARLFGQGTYFGQEQLNNGGRFREVTYLYFKEGEFRALPMEYYSWSKTYHLSRQGLVNTSVAGDEFYIVQVSGSAEILLVYNTKFFKCDLF